MDAVEGEVKKDTENNHNKDRISGKEVLGIIQSKQFKKMVDKFTEGLKKQGISHEAGFMVFFNLDSRKFTILETRDVDPYGASFGRDEREEHFRLTEDEDMIPIIDFHLHTPLVHSYQSNQFAPSLGDLRAYDDNDQSGYAEMLNMIGFVKGKENMDVLLIQQTSMTISDPNEIERSLKTSGSINETVGILRDYGYKTAWVNYGTKGIEGKDIETLEKFDISVKPPMPSPFSE